MQKVFGYPEFNENGEKVLTTYCNDYSDMMMDIRIYRIKAGESKTFTRAEEETAVLLLKGAVELSAQDKTVACSRKDVFTEGPYCVHGCKNTTITVKATSDCEILVQSTKNDNEFEAKFYAPEDAPWKYSCLGKFGNTAKRRVNTIFDADIAPYSNMVLGEVLNDPGNWSGYLPHRHVQPEVYYFLFDRPEGFGASFIDDQVYKSTDGSFSAIPGGALHPQVVAPGFQMYTCWMIRHLQDKKWLQTDRNEDERYLWLHDAQF
ncbi:MAG: 5-deoxy-glucuronate isomerase [Clostridia bacterium]|nr:5-deoxy-glucuronate isomerase [Clostridia bacterium]